MTAEAALTLLHCAGLDFDVGIGGSHALFKSTILGLLAQVGSCSICSIGCRERRCQALANSLA